MFENEKDFEEIVNRLNIDTQPNPIHRKNLRSKMLSVFEETKQQSKKQTTPLCVFRRTIMKSPVTKLAAAAVIIFGLLIMSRYLIDGHARQHTEQLHTTGTNQKDLQIEDDPFDKLLAIELETAKQLFEKKDLPGLLQLLQSGQDTVKFQVAEYLGQIGDESVLADLQVLASQFQGLEPDNIFEQAISAIQERLAESESEAVKEPLETVINQIPVEPQITPKEIQTGVSGIVLDKNTYKSIQGASVGFQQNEVIFTDADGRFTLTTPIFQQEVPVDVLSVEVPVYVTATDYASQRIVVHVEQGKMKDVTIELSPGSKINGRVIDPNNQPVSDAEVCILGLTNTSLSVLTDIDGKFEIDGIDPAYSTPRINVHHSVYPSVSIDFQPAPAGQSIYKEIILKSGIVVFGQVTNAQGKPVAGVTVGNTQSPLMWNVIKCETNEEGMYLLDNVDVGELTLWAVHNQFAPFVFNTTLDLSKANKQINIRLSDPYELKGSVLDSQENPVPGTFVVMDEYNGVRNISKNHYPCNPDGTFIIPNAPKDGELELQIFGQGITSTKHNVDFSQDEQAVIVESSGRIYGKVIDAETGKPIPKFHVRMNASRTGNRAYGYSVTWSEEGHTFNSPDGFFDTGRQNLPIDKHYRITVSAEGYDPLTNDLVVVKPISDDPNRTQFMLQHATLRFGRVVSVDSQAIEGASIVFYPNENVNRNEILPRATTDKEGNYSILGLGSEFKIIEVNAPDYTPNIYLLEDISQPNGQFNDIVLDHGASLYGYAFDEKGMGIADVKISAYFDTARTNNVRTSFSSLEFSATTDKNGFYQLSGIPSGKLRISAFTETYYQQKKIDILPGQSMELNFADEDGFIISGVVKAGEDALENARVILISSDGENIKRTVTDAQGQFKAYFLSENTYRLRVGWTAKNLSTNTKFPEDAYFNVNRPLKIERNMELEIDMQTDTVIDTQSNKAIQDE